MTTETPAVSVLLPVHNGAAYIESAVRSMMTQTLRDIEILVVDDGSTDETPAILARLAQEDDRLRVIRPERNLRLPRALNFGLEHVRGRYVARMDADDLSEPTRLEVQLRYLQAHPEIALVACSAIHIDADDNIIKTSVRAQTPFCARWLTRFGMPFRHPTLLFEHARMTLRYDPERTVSEDYDLIARLTETEKVACLPDTLLRYREHGGSLTGNKWSLMQQQAKEIATLVQKSDLPPAIFEGLTPFREAYYDLKPLSAADRTALFDGLREMMKFDTANAPEHAAWIARQTAQLGQHALMRSGEKTPGIVRAFLRHGFGLWTPLGLRFLEVRQMLPSGLRSEPTV